MQPHANSASGVNEGLLKWGALTGRLRGDSPVAPRSTNLGQQGDLRLDGGSLDRW